MDLLQVSNLSKKTRETTVLNNISFQFTDFRRLAIAGETGSGKTSLLKAIAGLLQPDNGVILFSGEKIAGPEERLLPGHPQIGYLSQHFELRSNYKVNDYLEMAITIGEKEALRIYELCQIERLLHRRTDQLSGGERQRTALARLLTTSPRLLLLDEPFSNLDSLHKQVLKNVLADLVREGKTSCLMVSHDPVDILPWAEEVIVLKEGSVIQQGTPEAVYHKPQTVYTGGLFGDFNVLSERQSEVLFGMEGLPDDKKPFIRPEKILLTKAASEGLTGTVSASYFFGSYYEIEVIFAGAKLMVKTTGQQFENGGTVTISIRKEDCSFL
jgi:ABC-type sulfate/molybdate transport systems ATPase subunit